MKNSKSRKNLCDLLLEPNTLILDSLYTFQNSASDLNCCKQFTTLRPLETISTLLGRASSLFQLKVSPRRKLAKWVQSLTYVLDINVTPWCKLLAVNPLLFVRTNLDHFLDLSLHLIGKLGLHSSEWLLCVSWCLVAGKMRLRAQHCGRESLIVCEKSCQLRHSDRNIRAKSISHPVVRTPIDEKGSVPGCFKDLMTHCEPNLTFPVFVRAF